MDITISKPLLGKEERKAIERVIESGWYINGKETPGFEKEFKSYIGTRQALACSSGTTAIELGLEALEIKTGDKIIVPSHTAFPTVESILNVGATPVFIDIDETYTLSPNDLEYDVRVKAVLGVHLYGHPFDIKPVKDFCDKNNLLLIEDAAQACGTRYNGKKAGSFGDVGCFSFYPTKNMTVGGDGGMITTNDEEVAEKIKLLRSHGYKDGDHLLVGHNYRMSEISAAIGREQLKKLDNFNNLRRNIARTYNDSLLNVVTPIEKEYAYHTYHQYVIRTRFRNSLRSHLYKKGIETLIHYPKPTHLTTAIQKYAFLKNTQLWQGEILSLPMHPSLKMEEIDKTIESINNFQLHTN